MQGWCFSMRIVFLSAVVGGVVQLMDGYGGRDETTKAIVEEEIEALRARIDSLLATNKQDMLLMRREMAEQAFALEERLTKGLAEEGEMREYAIATLGESMAPKSLVAAVQREAGELSDALRRVAEDLRSEKSTLKSWSAEFSEKLKALSNEATSTRAEDLKREELRQRSLDETLEKHVEAMTFAVGNWTSEFDARCSQAVSNVSETLANDRATTVRALERQESLLEETISDLESTISASLASCQDFVKETENALRAEVAQSTEKTTERLDEKFRTANAVLNATALGFETAIGALLQKEHCSSHR